jgi:hypothetical protein
MVKYCFWTGSQVFSDIRFSRVWEPKPGEEPGMNIASHW